MRRSTPFLAVVVAALVLSGCSDERAGGQAGEAVLVSEGEVDSRDLPIGEPFVFWLEPGATLGIYYGGSGTDGCHLVPIEAWTDEERIEVDFEPLSAGACTDDLISYLYEVRFPEPFDVEGSLAVTFTGVEGSNSASEVVLPPDPFEPPLWEEFE